MSKRRPDKLRYYQYNKIFTQYKQNNTPENIICEVFVFQVEVEHVNDELFAKREEFRSRMDNCAQRQIEIQKKQQKVKILY